MSLWPISYKKVWELKFVSITRIHLGSRPITSHSIKFFTHHPTFRISSLFPCFSKHKFDMDSIWRRSEHRFFFIMERIIIVRSASRYLNKRFISLRNETWIFWFFVRFWWINFELLFFDRDGLFFNDLIYFNFLILLLPFFFNIALTFEPLSLSK